MVAIRRTTGNDFLRELKKASSLWVHETIGNRSFEWQEGYGAFTVSAPSRKKVKAYIANQVEHHRKSGFKEVFIELLERAEIEYDPKYLD